MALDFNLRDMTGIGSIADFAKTVVERIWPAKMSDAEHTAATMVVQQMLEARETALLEAQKAVLVAELSQGDGYTKRARPSVIYVGLVFIGLVHVAFPIVTFVTLQELPALALPEEFWWAWTGICGTWVLGRSAERFGLQNKVIGAITGNGK